MDSVVKFVTELQRPDGSFTGDKWGKIILRWVAVSILLFTGEVDTRFSFCAVATLALLVSL